MRKIRIKILTIVLTILAIQSSCFAYEGISGNTLKTSSNSACLMQEKRRFALNNFIIIQTTLEKLGIPNDELETLIKQGKNLEQVLKEKDIPVRKFKKEVLKEYYKAVDEGIDNKLITPEEGKRLKSAIKETIKGWLPKNK